MAKKSNAVEINKQFWNVQNNAQIYDEYQHYVQANGITGSEAVPAYYTFAMDKTKGNIKYCGYTQDELASLLKSKFNR